MKKISVDHPFNTIQRLRQMPPEDFEKFVKILFELKGYKVMFHADREYFHGERHPKPDGGIDLEVEKDHNRKYIQIKKYFRKQVGINLMKHLYASIYDNDGTEEQGIMITTSIFHQKAIAYGKRHNMKMIDYRDILKDIKKLSKDKKKKEKLESFINNVKYARNYKYSQNVKTCNTCYAPLIADKKNKRYICMRRFEGCHTQLPFTK